MNSKYIKFIKLPMDSKLEILMRKIISPIDSKVRWKNKLGRNSLIRKPIMLRGRENITIGSNVTIRRGGRIEAISEWNGEKYNPQLIIGNNVTIEENIHIACAEKIVIGHDVTISFDVMIMDNEHIFVSGRKIFHNPLKTASVFIGDYTFIGAGAKILKGVKIGKNCIIGAGAVVTKDIPDNSVAVGAPARIR